MRDRKRGMLAFALVPWANRSRAWLVYRRIQTRRPVKVKSFALVSC